MVRSASGVFGGRMNGKKVIVIGCPGSGKTTFAEKLHARTGLPLFHLDAIWHMPDRTHISRDEFDERLGEILQLDAWIIDGNYSRTLARRMQVCDTVFFFDLPTEDCIKGALERINKKRCDIPFIDTELDPRLCAEIEAFPEKNRPDICQMLLQYERDRQIVTFRTRSEADAFLVQLG